MASTKAPSVFMYMNYLDFLKDLESYLEVQHQLTRAEVARMLGFGSANYLKILVDGKRSLRAKTAQSLAYRINLKKEESEFFVGLVQLATTQEAKKREQILSRLLKFKSFQKARHLGGDELALDQNWLNLCWLESLHIPRFQQMSDAELAHEFQVDISEVKSAFKVLTALKLVTDSESGKRQSVNRVIETDPEVQSQWVRVFHLHTLEKAKQA